MQNDGKMATTTLQQATRFPGILSKQTEASGSILTSQTWLVGGNTQTLQSQISGLIQVSLQECFAIGGHSRDHDQ